jgi:hypothetical protein
VTAELEKTVALAAILEDVNSVEDTVLDVTFEMGNGPIICIVIVV